MISFESELMDFIWIKVNIRINIVIYVDIYVDEYEFWFRGNLGF